VTVAVQQMRVDMDELGAESYPYEKRLRIPFVAKVLRAPTVRLRSSSGSREVS
jgi:hypothetical protein